jgi:vitamin B12 transporter
MRLLFSVTAPACAALLLLGGPARAQAPADTARYMLPLVEVTAVRGQTEAALRTVRVVALTRDDLAASGVATLADALERRGGAFVRRYGPGGLASVSLRGSGAGHTALLLDGLRLNDPQLGQVDLSLLPAAVLDGATVAHGATAAWHGADAVGGAVLLTPRRRDGLDLRVGGGAFGTARLEGAAGAAGRGVDATVTGMAEASTGRFAYDDPTQFPARRTVREGADRRLVSMLTTLAWHGRPGMTQGGLWLAEAARGLPGPAGMPPAGERQDDAHARLWAIHRRTLGPAALRVAGWAHAGRLRYRHPRLGLDETARTRVIGGEVEVTARPAPVLTLGGGVAASQAVAVHPSLADAGPERMVAAFWHADVVRGPITLAAALRFDHYAQAASYTPLSPRLSGRLDLGRGWAVKAGGGRSFRAPTFNDRFWRGAGRTDLRPEQGWSGEGGFAWANRVLTAEATAFVQPEGGGVWRPSNVRRTRTHGLEASLRGGRGPFTGGAFATLTNALDRSTPGSATYGQQLRFVPRVTARADAELVLAGPARTRWRLDAAMQAVGPRPVTSDGTQALPAYALVGAGVAVTHGAFTLDVRLENALDAAYRVVEGYPMPGRHAFAGLRFRPERSR